MVKRNDMFDLLFSVHCLDKYIFDLNYIMISKYLIIYYMEMTKINQFNVCMVAFKLEIYSAKYHPILE